MKYFHELSNEDQDKVLDRLQNLPLFNVYRDDSRKLLTSSMLYTFDDKLNMFVNTIRGETDGMDNS